jgi:hypothetical protein
MHRNAESPRYCYAHDLWISNRFHFIIDRSSRIAQLFFITMFCVFFYKSVIHFLRVRFFSSPSMHQDRKNVQSDVKSCVWNISWKLHDARFKVIL